MSLFFSLKFSIVLFTLLVLSLTWGCASTSKQTTTPTENTRTSETSPAATSPEADTVLKADVISVKVSGDPGAYRFAVEIRSPDLGCNQYADWWEVIDENGELVYRRILTHSHVNEQPFVRSGGPVPIAPDTVVWVRAHMNPGGYGGMTYKGSAKVGFEGAEISPDFAAGLAEKPPLPDGCDF